MKKIIYSFLISLLLLCLSSCKKQRTIYNSIDELDGKKFGCVVGAVSAEITKEYFKDPIILNFSTYPDCVLAVLQNKLDAFVISDVQANMYVKEYPNIKKLGSIPGYKLNICIGVNKERKDLTHDISSFISEIQNNGQLDKIKEKWSGDDEEAKVIDYDKLKDFDKTLTVVTTAADIPHSYTKMGQIVGIDMDLMFNYCLSRGYKMDIIIMEKNGIVSAIKANKADVAAAFMSATEEREKNMDFTIPYAVVDYTVLAYAEGGSTTNLINSFKRSLIDENRWQLILKGLLVTLIITIGATIFGIIFGFAFYFLRCINNKVLSTFIDCFFNIMSGTPALVILMLLFYVIFANFDISGIVVAIIGFGINLSVTFAQTLKTCVLSIDKGQSEASVALGFSRALTFKNVIFPQALMLLVPIIKGEIVSMMKMTSVVGYIAIEDLTKMIDIIRSETFEAFFPIIISAIAYCIIAFLIIFIFSNIQIKIDPKNRKESVIKKYYGID